VWVRVEVQEVLRAMSDLPEPPRGERDDQGHPVHPYVRRVAVDPSAPGFVDARGEEVTAERRTRESQLAFHAIEPLTGVLTPFALAMLMYSCALRLYSPASAEDLKAMGLTAEKLDVRGELLPFEALHEDDLKAIVDARERVIGTCPGCGARQCDGGHDDGRTAPGGYVDAKSGESVRVVRVEARRVHVVVQVTPERSIDRVYERDEFERRFVRGDDVEILTIDGGEADPRG